MFISFYNLFTLVLELFFTFIGTFKGELVSTINRLHSYFDTEMTFDSRRRYKIIAISIGRWRQMVSKKSKISVPLFKEYIYYIFT